jgi:TPR repeat protein
MKPSEPKPLLFTSGLSEIADKAGDYAAAVKWYSLSADQANAQAQNNLGIMYEIGHGVKQDHAEAQKWFRLAAGQGLATV